MDRRTVTVLAALVGSMTVATAALIMLEPAPMRQAGGFALTAMESTPDGIDAIFDTPTAFQPQRWGRIVVHHSGEVRGNASRIHELHQQGLGYGGLGYHFVIGNGVGAADGTGSTDGAIEVGYRWMDQTDGAYVPGAISVCLIGNGDQVRPTEKQMKQLVRLVRALQARAQVHAADVVLHSEMVSTTSPGRLFPASRFRDQLIR